MGRRKLHWLKKLGRPFEKNANGLETSPSGCAGLVDVLLGTLPANISARKARLVELWASNPTGKTRR